MVTWRIVVGLGLGVAACGGSATGGGDTPGAPAPSPEERPVLAVPPGTVEPGGSGTQYPGRGFRVHEWGTNTIVVGSDGSMQRGLHHEEEDLPSFVYDRKSPEIGKKSVDVKMETPVAYFYSEKPLTARVNVRFPDGVLTQWYPSVASYFPLVLSDRGDPVLDRSFPYSTPECRIASQAIKDGMLDWGDIEVLPREAKPALPDAPLDRFTWSHARDVAANSIRMRSQDERFLFYRGLGNFPIDVKIAAADGTTGDDGGLVLTNKDSAHPAGSIFVLRVTADKAAFTVHSGGIAKGASLAAEAPAATEPLETYAQSLATAMVAELDKAGLYHDESVAMVKTWARQWFRTPGVRVLYLAPQAWTDAQIPLSVSPAPEEIVRVMVIRVEAITRVEERVDLAALKDLDGDGAAQLRGDAHFQGLGRFAEPRLRRAIAQTNTPGKRAATYLDAIAGANVSAQAGE